LLNVDYEPLAVDRGRALEEKRFGDVRMEYAVADATELTSKRRFALVIDKSTADAVACAGDEALLKMAGCVERCLEQDGAWISVSYSERRFGVERLPLECRVIKKFPAVKKKETDPDIYYICYELRRKAASL
jgi:hypothetical protein